MEVILAESWLTIAPLVVFIAASIPLVHQDTADGLVKVSTLLLAVGCTALVGAGVGLGDLAWQLTGASLLLGGGTLISAVLPDRLGEADVVYAVALAFLFPFFSVIAVLAWACVAAFALLAWQWFRWKSLAGIAFTPCILFGAVAEFLWSRGAW